MRNQNPKPRCRKVPGLSVSGGDLATRDALEALDTGLAVGNLWYLNYSDRPACRMTGMTRFATFWVETGKVVAPVNVLRFDDTLYRMLGSKLEALTAENFSFTVLGRATYEQMAPVRGVDSGSVQMMVLPCLRK